MSPGRILFVLLLCGWLPASAFGDPGMPWARIAHALDLNAAQVHTLQAAEEAMFAEIHRIEAAVHAHEMGREEAHAEVHAARQILEAAWQETLTEDQKARWRQLQHDVPRHDRAHDRAPLWQRIGRIVDLTADQIHQLEAAEAAFIKRMHRIEAAAHDGSLSREEFQTHAQEARRTLDHALQEILSEGQLARLREVHNRAENSDHTDESALSSDLLSSFTAVPEFHWGQIKQSIKNR